jgi:maltooligosyltrehalose trehalohydrolase
VAQQPDGEVQPIRRVPIGAEVQPSGGVHFRVWAPDHQRVALVIDEARGGLAAEIAMEREAGGYFSRLVRDARPGTRYRYRLGDDRTTYPDLASRFQPDGPHGASEVVDAASFEWTDQRWPGVSLRGQVAYELHVGTFTAEGTFRSAARELPELARLGVTMVELMPVAEFPGRFGWGYDGVDLFAPTRLYGTPDDLRSFVDQAHHVGLAVILDVVYNHVGPDGAYFGAYSRSFFTDRHENEWGDALNFDGDDAGPVREFFIANAGYWIEEFHLDGLRLDATQAIHDESAEHVIAAIGRRARQSAGARSIVVVAENEAQETRLARPLTEGGYGLDGLWNDDFHHSLVVALTGRNEAYYSDYLGRPQELISAAKYGYLYQGQHYAWQRKGRGRPTWGLPPETFMTYIENHDQVANSGLGHRLASRTSGGRLRAATALLLLLPSTPMLFQGQEFSSSRPFLFFADHQGPLGDAVRRGRGQFLAQFPSLAGEEMQRQLADPSDPATFERCKLDLGERESHGDVYQLHRDLLSLRRRDPVFSRQRAGGVDGAVIGDQALALRFFGEGGHRDDRVLLVNFGRDLSLECGIDPLLAPPADAEWRVEWSSEAPLYGGQGTPPVVFDGGVRCPGESAIVLFAAPGSSR